MPVSFYGCYCYAYPLEVFRSADIFVSIPVATQSNGQLHTYMTIERYTLHSQQSYVENVTREIGRSQWMTQLGCDTPGAVPTSAVYIGESPSQIDAQAVMERSRLRCLVHASSRRSWPLPYQDWRIARTNSPSCFAAAWVTNRGDSELELDTDACPRFTVFSLDGPILRARGVTA
jgi:hypothetical protein